MNDARVDLIFAPELVRCVADGRDPSVAELFSVARRIWTEARQERSAFGWDRLPSEHPERIGALRVAQAALAGTKGHADGIDG